MAKGLTLVAVLLLPLAGASFLRQAPADPCACVNWRHAYDSQGAKCGDGHELYLITKTGVPRFLAGLSLGLEFCDAFYKRIDDSFCVNLDHTNAPDAWYGGQWCYVSGECRSAPRANGTGSLRVKLCTAGEDRMLRDKAPEELISWAAKNDFETGLLLKMAYPVDKVAQWPLVKESFLRPAAGSEGPDANGTASMKQPKALDQRLKELVASGKPIILDSTDGHPPFAVVRGSNAHLLELNKAMDAHHPNSVTTIKCVAGCSQ
uniref:Uncharacterized protein n=1 Tax=Alexandrium catenella TaxID=2925 RepID=A0A7S1WJE1_ALECA